MADNSISSMINSLRKQGNLGEALKKAREAKDSNGRVEIPDGNYVCRVTGAKLVPGDKPRVIWNLIVDRGPQKGATVPYRFDLYQRSWKDRKTDEKVTYTLDQAFEDASKNLQRVGVSPSKLPEGDIAAFLNAMLEFPENGPLVAITARKKGDFVNIYLNRRVEEAGEGGTTTSLITESSDGDTPFEPTGDEETLQIEIDDVVRYKAEGDQRATRWVVTETDNVSQSCALQEIAGRRRTVESVSWGDVEPMMA